MYCGGSISRHFLVGEFSYRPSRVADDQRAFWECLSFGNQRARADDRIFRDYSSVHYDGSHANQTVLADTTSVEHGAMPNRASVGNRNGVSRIRMDHGMLLDIAVSTNGYALGVTPNYRAEPPIET